MPRITSKRKDYKKSDARKWIAGKLREHGITQACIANELGITQQAMAAKIKNGSFTYADLIVIFHEAKLKDEEILKFMKY